MESPALPEVDPKPEGGEDQHLDFSRSPSGLLQTSPTGHTQLKASHKGPKGHSPSDSAFHAQSRGKNTE